MSISKRSSTSIVREAVFKQLRAEGRKKAIRNRSQGGVQDTPEWREMIQQMSHALVHNG